MSWANKGFTLVEVLIALVIVAFALGAFLNVGQVSVHQTFALKSTMLAQNEVWNQLVSEKDSTHSEYEFDKTIDKTDIKNISKVTISANLGEKQLSILSRYIYESK